MKNILFNLILFSSFIVNAQNGEFLGKLGTYSPGGLFVRAFPNHTVFICGGSFYATYSPSTNSFFQFVIPFDSAGTFNYIQELDSNRILVATNGVFLSGKSRFYLFHSNGTFKKLNLIGLENNASGDSKEVYYSKVYEDDVSLFMIKGSPELGYFNRVRLSSDLDPISEDTLLSGTNVPENIGYPHYGAYNGTHFVFGPRSGSFVDIPNTHPYSLNLNTGETENLLRLNSGTYGRVSNIINRNKLFFFRFKGEDPSFRGLYTSEGKSSSTSKWKHSPLYIGGAGDEVMPMFERYDQNNNLVLPSSEDILFGCKQNLELISENNDFSTYEVGSSFDETPFWLFADSVLFFVEMDECTNPPSNRINKFMKFTKSTGEKVQLNILSELQSIIDLNAQWAILCAKNKNNFLFNKKTEKFWDFEPNAEIGYSSPHGYLPNPYFDLNKRAVLIGEFIYYSIGDKIYRQSLPIINSTPSLAKTTSLQVFPNPSEKGSVQVRSDLEKGQYYWINVNGQRMESQKFNGKHFNAKTPIVPGLYILKIQHDAGDNRQAKVVVK